jgi:hypothetical protein
MWSLIPLLAVPFAIMIGFKIVGGKDFTVPEFLSLEAGMVLLLVCGFSMARCGAMMDTEVWSGRIVEKPSGSQHCCHCRQECDTCTDSEGDTYDCNCREVCDHFRDYWWALDISTGDRISIDSCEPRKSRVPAAWTNAKIGEPAAVEHHYMNYLKADPESVLIQSADVSEATKADYGTPNYPRVHSFYRINRAINLGTNMSVPAWNSGLMDLNADIGSEKQINVIVIATAESDPRYADHIEREWLYGKKNDLIFVLGAPDGNTVKWARVVTISRVEMLKVKARDELAGTTLDNPDETIAQIGLLVLNHFERTPMAEFEYLSSAAKPQPWALFLLYFLAIVGSVFGSIFMVTNDAFGRGVYRGYKSYRGRRW